MNLIFKGFWNPGLETLEILTINTIEIENSTHCNFYGSSSTISEMYKNRQGYILFFPMQVLNFE